MIKKEYSGIWWIPGTEKQKKIGTLLQADDGRLQLQISGSFIEYEVPDFESRVEMMVSELNGQELGKEYLIINGILQTGEAVTLFQCKARGNSMINMDYISQKIEVKFCLIGAHFKTQDELFFDKIEMQYSHLADWVGITSNGRLYEPGTDGIKRCTYNYDFLEIEAEGINDDGDSIKTSYDKQALYNLEQVNIKKFPVILYKLSVAKSLEEIFNEVVMPLQNFLIFATDKPNDISFVRVYSNINGEDKIIRVLRNFVKQDQMEDSEHDLKTDSLFSLKDIKDNFQIVFSNWFAINKELRTECTLFVAVKYFDEMHLRHQFLNIVQTLESYHRLKINNACLEKSEHQKRVKSVLSIIRENCQEYEQWIAPKLNNNEPSLKSRLNDIVDLINDFIALEKNSFANRVRDARNSLTHVLKRKIDTKELYCITQTLVIAFQIVLLRELGLEAEVIKKILENYSNYYGLIRMCKGYDWIRC